MDDPTPQKDSQKKSRYPGKGGWFLFKGVNLSEKGATIFLLVAFLILVSAFIVLLALGQAGLLGTSTGGSTSLQ
ncbi:MAG: hypothetical protein BWY98_00711 [Tenericutes bacterium ADurb.BinA155]|jgi:hypothetical protein|nr:MAG: hypothetical protein BWY98_00711 [Tenericutes bacterium ADurb.BinA155]